MTKTKLKLDIGYDEGVTTYTLIDTSISDDTTYIMNELLSIEVFDGNFKHGSEDKYHEKVKKFINELIKAGDGWDD